MSETSLSLLDRLTHEPQAAAWDQFVELYRPLLTRWLTRYGVQGEDADDLTQETLMVVVRELPRFRHAQRAGSLRAWLRTILVHRLRDFWRSRSYRPLATGNTDFQAQLADLADDASRISQVWNREHDELVMQRLLEAVRGRFAPQTWQAFRRQVIDGLSAEGVATELGMALGSVYVAKSRVLNALRREAAGLLDLD
ncbi:MAG TPA: sigma-70 family RNA polymerase sigma factor [Pirellulaceae bacterium]|nr:sigma-70 family RNA polymerase sigma factor [Pirellulaceae bacterium]